MSEMDWRDRFNIPRDTLPRTRRELAELAVRSLSNHEFLNLFGSELSLRASATIGDNTCVIPDPVEGQSFDVQIADHDPLYDPEI